ncbi:MAG: carboxymuconolactone decarboxylase family protein [Syntrophaceae bacterium]
MARIPYVTVEAVDAEKSALLGLNPQLNIFKIAAHATTVIARKFIGLPAAVLLNGTLDPVLREMAIVRTGILCRSDYEVYQHRKVSRRVGMPEEKIEALDIGSSAAVFSELERLVLRFTEETVEFHKAGDATFSALLQHFSHEQIVELAIAVGCYMMVSTFLNTFEVDIEDKVKPS